VQQFAVVTLQISPNPVTSYSMFAAN
jgi:hypothetical protein